jgi:hypothetical protein
MKNRKEKKGYREIQTTIYFYHMVTFEWIELNLLKKKYKKSYKILCVTDLVTLKLL